MSKAAATGVPRVLPQGARDLVLSARFPDAGKSPQAGLTSEGISVYAVRSIFGIAVARILGLKMNYWEEALTKHLNSSLIPKDHRGTEKCISNDLCRHCQTVCVAGWG